MCLWISPIFLFNDILISTAPTSVECHVWFHLYGLCKSQRNSKQEKNSTENIYISSEIQSHKLSRRRRAPYTTRSHYPDDILLVYLKAIPINYIYKYKKQFAQVVCSSGLKCPPTECVVFGSNPAGYIYSIWKFLLDPHGSAKSIHIKSSMMFTELIDRPFS